MDLTGKFLSAFSLLGSGPLAGAELVPARLATACASVLPIAGAGISVFTADGIRIPVGASDADSSNAERLQFTAAEGPCLVAHGTGRPVVASEAVLAQQWPLFHHRLITQTPFRAITSLPLQNGLADFATMDLYFRRSEDALAIDMTAVDGIVEHISETLIEEMPAISGAVPQRPIPPWLDSPTAEDRNWVFLALGLLNVDLELSTQDALAVLRARAYSNGETIDETARDIVNQALPLSQLHLDSNT